MSHTLQFVEEAVADLRALDPPLQKLAWKQMQKIAQAPELGKPLGSRMRYDLTRLRTIRFYHEVYRVVYEVFEKEKTVKIWGIGKREREEIYRMIAHRRAKR
jgi:mRNA-degrading endonuclease RelE of RelBE toxin-antitoxin system